ncbi:hypothetical protein D4R86_03050 [bacterium]|nr:MAG: hypothetical protein D4R86_03050 [bacterium]
MFKCYLCNEIISAGTPCNIIPVKIREKEYKNKGGSVFGWEIVKEGKFCPKCAESYESPVPEKRLPKSFRQYNWFSEFTNKKPPREKKERSEKVIRVTKKERTDRFDKRKSSSVQRFR